MFKQEREQYIMEMPSKVTNFCQASTYFIF